jgi:gamma-glutamylcyclotransferase (GGCT)/AIG2-like uncharacterized protein YtfP
MGGADQRLFVYGTLMYPAVFQAVCGASLLGQAATLEGYVRRRVRDAIYPAIVACAGARTTGLLVEDLDDGQWARLDAFEGAAYARIVVAVERTADGIRLPAQTYVAAPAAVHALLDEIWSPTEFSAADLQRYLA